MSLFDSASLVVTPNGYKEDKLYSIKPTNGSGDLTVTRATTATRVNSAGLIEEAPYNLLQRSEEFNNAIWTKTNTTITANTTTAPNGSLTADTLTEDTNNSTHLILQAFTLSTIPYTFSCFVKSNGRSKINFRLFNAISFNFDLVAQTATSGASITSVGNGWFKLVATGTPPDTLSRSTSIRLLDNSNNETYLGNGTSGVFLWGAQLDLGTSAKEYFPTTDRLDVPRLDYTNSSCPSILVEPQRTNLALRSEEFDNAYWVKTNSTVTANQVNSPNGTLTADRLVDTVTTGEHNIEKQITVTAGTNTFSIFAKKDNNRYFEIGVVNTINSGARFIFDFDTKTITSFGAIGATVTYVRSNIVELANGWFKLSLTYTSSTTNPFFLAGLSNSPNVGTTNLVSYTGDGTKGVYIWGAQVEVGSNPTSYISTVASTVTRNADTISKTGISSLIGQTEGTVFVDVNLNSRVTQTYFAISSSATAVTDYIGISFRASTIVFEIVRAGALQANHSLSNSSTGRFKLGIGYKANDFVFYSNGVQLSTDNSGTVPACNDIVLINSTFSQNQALNYNSVQLYKTRLSNTELAQLTTI